MKPPACVPDPDESVPYRVEPEGDGFAVVDLEDKVIIKCSASANAEQYSALLNESYRRGYKAGFRNGRRTG
jgi:hypothetical protein